MADIIKCQECGIIVGQYVSLVEHENLMADFAVAQAQLFNLPATNKLLTKIEMENEKLETLLKRWNEIAPGASWVIDNAGNSDLADEIDKLILDTSEAIK